MIRAYLAAVAVTAGLDLIWLGFIAKDLYRRNLGHLMAADVRWWSAVLFYLIYGAGVLYFAVISADSSRRKALVNGALLGLLVYSTYDFTNLAILRDWPVGISMIDIAWGAFLTAMAAAAAQGLIAL